MAFANAAISDIIATTIQSRTGVIQDNVTSNNALLMRLKQRGNMKTFTGGNTIMQELSFASNGNAGWYSGYDGRLVPDRRQHGRHRDQTEPGQNHDVGDECDHPGVDCDKRLGRVEPPDRFLHGQRCEQRGHEFGDQSSLDRLDAWHNHRNERAHVASHHGTHRWQQHGVERADDDRDVVHCRVDLDDRRSPPNQPRLDAGSHDNTTGNDTTRDDTTRDDSTSDDSTGDDSTSDHSTSDHTGHVGADAYRSGPHHIGNDGTGGHEPANDLDPFHNAGDPAALARTPIDRLSCASD